MTKRKEEIAELLIQAGDILNCGAAAAEKEDIYLFSAMQGVMHIARANVEKAASMLSRERAFQGRRSGGTLKLADAAQLLDELLQIASDTGASTFADILGAAAIELSAEISRRQRVNGPQEPQPDSRPHPE